MFILNVVISRFAVHGVFCFTYAHRCVRAWNLNGVLGTVNTIQGERIYMLYVNVSQGYVFYRLHQDWSLITFVCF